MDKLSNEKSKSPPTGPRPRIASSKTTRLKSLSRNLSDPAFRHGYLSRQVKAYLSAQIRALRGEKSQEEFGKALGKPQSVVSRLENQETSVNIQTLLDIANKLDVGLVVRFVDYPSLLQWMDDPSQAAVTTQPYRQEAVDQLVRRGRRLRVVVFRGILGRAPGSHLR